MGAADAETTGGAASVSYECDECGKVTPRNNPPCSRCGSMSLSTTEAIDDPSRLIDEDESWDLVRDANREITGVGVFVTLVGVGTTLLGAWLLSLGGRVLGPALVAAGLLATPFVRRRVERVASIRLSPLAVLGLYLGFAVGGFALASLL